MGRLTHTVSGSIATVRSPAVAPIESLKVHFSPIQEGTGDPSPSNVRPITGWTGVNTTKVRNIWDGRYEKGYINASGQVVSSNNTFVNVGYIDVIPNSKIKFRFTRTNIYAANIHLFYYNENKEYITDRWIGSVGDINISANTRYIRFQMDTAYSAVYDGKDLSVYYSNEAETIPVTFPAVGKNLFNKDAEPYQTGKYINDVSSGVPQYSNNASYNVYRIPIKPATAYTFGPIKSGSSGSGPIWATMNANGITTRYAFNAGGSEGAYHTFTSYSSDAYLLLSVAVTNDYGYKCDDILQVEEGSSATEYEAFDNTVYGGYVDLATGNIVATYAKAIFDGSIDEPWGINTYPNQDINRFVLNKTFFTYPAKNGTNNVFINYCITRNTQLPWRGFIGSTGNALFYAPDDEIVDKDAWCTYLSEHNLEICYEMDTPTVVATLTPQELETFKGYSNFWSNAGDVDVTYQVVESSEMTKERQKIFAGNAPTIHTSSGSIANFNMEPGLNRNLKSCKVGFLPVQEGSGDPFPPINQNGSIVGVDNLHNESELSSFKIHFSPIQSGSGDPSPTNIRPITGWTGVTGYKGGKSLLPFLKDSMSTAIDYNGYSGWQSKQYIDKSLKGAKVTYSAYIDATSVASGSGDNCAAIWAQDSNGTYILAGSRGNVIQPGNSGWSKVTLIIPVDTDWITFGLTLKTNGAASNPMVELGTEQTSYEAYSAPTSYPVSWESQGTVYGGYMDLVSGDVVATMLYKKHRVGDSQVDATYENTKRIDVLLDSDCLSKANGTTSNTISSYFTYAYNNLDNPHFYLTDPNRIRCFVPIDVDDNTEIEFACTLLNPTVVTTLTPQQITLATGKSSYWSNTNSVTVETVGNVRPIHGWGKINAIRCGKNLYPFPTSSAGPYAYWVNGSYPGFDTSEISSITEKALNNENVTFSTYFDSTNSNGNNRTAVKIWARDKDDSAWSILGVEGNDIIAGTSGRSSKNITFGDHASITFGMSMAIGSVGSNPMVEYGASLSDYEPYNGNIFPITFPVQGKNLFNGQYVKGLITGNTSIGYTWNNSGTNANSAIIKCSPNTAYTIKKHSSSNRFSIATCSHYPVLNDVLNLIVENSNISQYTCTTGNDAEYLIVYVSTGTEQAEPNLMVEVGSIASTYESYNNSIFGGYVDLVTGEVWSNYMVLDLGSTNWTYYKYGNYNGGYNNLFQKNLKKYTANELPNAYCTHLFMYDDNTFNNLNMNHCITINTFGMIKVKYDEATSAVHLKSLLSGVLLVAELETPQLVTTLTPTQIQALKGTNNILSDANGIIEVKYWSH